jgi:hypothetical protein
LALDADVVVVGSGAGGGVVAAELAETGLDVPLLEEGDRIATSPRPRARTVPHSAATGAREGGRAGTSPMRGATMNRQNKWRRNRCVAAALALTAGMLTASPAVAAPPSIDDQTFTVSREQALEAYEESGIPYLDCGDFVVLAAFTVERRVITFEDRELRLISFTGELFRLDTGVTVTYAGSSRREATFGPTGEIETITITGLAEYLIDLEGNRIVFDAGLRSVDFSSFPPTFTEHGIHRLIEVVCGALA